MMHLVCFKDIYCSPCVTIKLKRVNPVFLHNSQLTICKLIFIIACNAYNLHNADIFTTTKHQILNTSQVSQNEAVITQQSQVCMCHAHRLSFNIFHYVLRLYY